MGLQLNERSSAPATPASTYVELYADTTATPSLKFIDDAGTVKTLLDDTNTVTGIANKTFVAPVLGVATGTSLAVTGLLKSSSATAGIGYATGAGGTGSQATSKSTAVTMSPTGCMCGTITMNAAALAAGAIVTFVVNNSSIATGDYVATSHDSVGTLGGYTIDANTIVNATSFQITVRNNTAGSLSEAIVLKFAIIKAVTS